MPKAMRFFGIYSLSERKKDMEFTRKTTVNVSADKAWEIIGADFNEVSQWASAVITSEANPDLDPGEKGRICNVKGTGHVVENIYAYDDEERELAFTLEGQKIPFFMRKIDNKWSVKPLGPNQSEVQVTGNITLMPVFSQLMSGMLKKQMGKFADGLLDEFKFYAEKWPRKKNAEAQVANSIIKAKIVSGKEGIWAFFPFSSLTDSVSKKIIKTFIEEERRKIS